MYRARRIQQNSKGITPYFIISLMYSVQKGIRQKCAKEMWWHVRETLPMQKDTKKAKRKNWITLNTREGNMGLNTTGSHARLYSSEWIRHNYSFKAGQSYIWNYTKRKKTWV